MFRRLQAQSLSSQLGTNILLRLSEVKGHPGFLEVPERGQGWPAGSGPSEPVLCSSKVGPAQRGSAESKVYAEGSSGHWDKDASAAPTRKKGNFVNIKFPAAV